MIRIGICGAGAIVGNHVNAARRVPGLSVGAISSRTIETARKTAAVYGIPAALDDHRRLIESPEIDAVVVAAPNYLHFDLAMRAIEMKKPVMVEKPLAMTVAEGEALVEASKRAGVPLIYAEQLPLAPKFARLAEMAREGAFGRIYMIRQIERHAGPYSPWFFDRKTSGGGALMDLGCHSIAVVREITGNRPVARVTGYAKTFAPERGDVEDFMIVHMIYEDGTIGVVESNWRHLGGMDSVTEVFGDAGNGYADLMKGSGITTFTAANPAGSRWTQAGWNKPMFDPAWECGYVAQAQAFLATVEKGIPPVQSGEDGLEILKIMHAAYVSAGVK